MVVERRRVRRAFHHSDRMASGRRYLRVGVLEPSQGVQAFAGERNGAAWGPGAQGTPDRARENGPGAGRPRGTQPPSPLEPKSRGLCGFRRLPLAPIRARGDADMTTTSLQQFHWNGLHVPFIAPWSEEKPLPYKVIRRVRPDGAEGIHYADEVSSADRRDGNLWV